MPEFDYESLAHESLLRVLKRNQAEGFFKIHLQHPEMEYLIKLLEKEEERRKHGSSQPKLEEIEVAERVIAAHICKVCRNYHPGSRDRDHYWFETCGVCCFWNKAGTKSRFAPRGNIL